MIEVEEVESRPRPSLMWSLGSLIFGGDAAPDAPARHRSKHKWAGPTTVEYHASSVYSKYEGALESEGWQGGATVLSAENARPHGEGCLTWKSGASFQGCFDHGLIRGPGELRSSHIPGGMVNADDFVHCIGRGDWESLTWPRTDGQHAAHNADGQRAESGEESTTVVVRGNGALGSGGRGGRGGRGEDSGGTGGGGRWGLIRRFSEGGQESIVYYGGVAATSSLNPASAQKEMTRESRGGKGVHSSNVGGRVGTGGTGDVGGEGGPCPLPQGSGKLWEIAANRHYEGEFTDGLRHGEGTEREEISGDDRGSAAGGGGGGSGGMDYDGAGDGNRSTHTMVTMYKGSWCKGIRHGFGVGKEISRGGGGGRGGGGSTVDTEYSGLWKGGKRHGKGEFRSKTGTTRHFAGTFREGRMCEGRHTKIVEGREVDEHLKVYARADPFRRKYVPWYRNAGRAVSVCGGAGSGGGVHSGE